MSGAWRVSQSDPGHWNIFDASDAWVGEIADETIARAVVAAHNAQGEEEPVAIAWRYALDQANARADRLASEAQAACEAGRQDGLREALQTVHFLTESWRKDVLETSDPGGRRWEMTQAGERIERHLERLGVRLSTEGEKGHG